MEIPNRRTQLLKRKSMFLKEFLRLTVQQKQALNEKEMGRFNELLAAKQLVIEQVDLLDVELDLIKKRDLHHGDEKKGVPGGAKAGRTEQTTGWERAIKLYLRQIRELDIEINALMETTMAETIKSINELQLARRTQNAYHNQAGATHSYFVNKKR